VESRILYVNQKERRKYVALPPLSENAKMLKITKGRLHNEAPFWRERVDHLLRRWWIVDSSLLEQRKTYGCNKYPFYKKIPLPDSNLNSHLSNLFFGG